MDEQNEQEVIATEQMSFVDDKYRFKLENFEGPLDLLLHLIKDAKMDIMTVKLADITEQYLQYMQDIDSIDMDRASEFITVAATLIEIKSKHLLPVEQDDEVDEEDSEALLLERLKEYELFKETGKRLKEIEDINKLYRAPGKETEKVKIVIKDMVLDKDGKCLTTTFTDYGVPMIEEAPDVFKAELVDVNDQYGPFGAKSISEIACNGAAPAIAMAIADATGVWVRTWPITGEKILKALGRF